MNPNVKEIKIHGQSKLKKKNRKRFIENVFKENLTNFLDQATLKIYYTPFKVIKVFMTICVLGSSGLALLLVIKSVMNFFNYEVSTTSRTLYETSTLFHKITFCNANRYTTEYAYNFLGENYEHYYDLKNLTLEEMKKLGHSLKETLFFCSFKNIPCALTDFVWSFDPQYGNCYTFNSGFYSNGTKTDLKGSTLSGLGNGLYLR